MADWLPIETAPDEEFKGVRLLLPDGREVGGFRRDGNEIATEDDAFWWPSAWYDEDFRELDPQPTHWLEASGGPGCLA